MRHKLTRIEARIGRIVPFLADGCLVQERELLLSGQRLAALNLVTIAHQGVLEVLNASFGWLGLQGVTAGLELSYLRGGHILLIHLLCAK